MRVLVTGANGFVGRHLCPYLKARGDEVVEAHGPDGGGASGGLALDVTDAASTRRAVAEAKPEGIIHLAGISSVSKSHQAPALAFSVNALGSVHLVQAVRQERPRCRVLLVGSGEMYGAVPEGQRADEGFPLAPLSPYAAAKAAAELVGFQFHRSYGLEVVSARSFNHLGKGQDPDFVVPSFARQIQAIGRNQAEPVLKVGDLSPIRDFSHVADVVEAYRLLLERGAPGQAYNVCSGRPQTIRQLLDQMLSLAGVSARVETDASRLRPSELKSLVGDPAKLIALGWKPKRSATDALAEVLAEPVEG